LVRGTRTKAENKPIHKEATENKAASLYLRLRIAKVNHLALILETRTKALETNQGIGFV
jgi:hypothetical protein